MQSESSMMIPGQSRWLLARKAGALAAFCAAIGLIIPALGSRADDVHSPIAPPRFRGPVALVLADEGKTLLTANRRAGSISIVDTAAGRVTGEVSFGKRLSALAA